MTMALMRRHTPPPAQKHLLLPQQRSASGLHVLRPSQQSSSSSSSQQQSSSQHAHHPPHWHNSVSRQHLALLCGALGVLCYAATLSVFQRHSSSASSSGAAAANAIDAVVVGSGLAGLSAALSILDRGGRVVLVEKEHVVGGNSNRASSGINACCFDDALHAGSGDTLELFRADTTRSAGRRAQPELIDALTARSAEAIRWLRDRCRVDLSVLAQLGGHSVKRTHRPAEGMVGAEIVAQLRHELRAFEEGANKKERGKPRLQLYTDSVVTQLLYSDDDSSNNNSNKQDESTIPTVTGVQFKAHDGALRTLHAHSVILATGGFASDRSSPHSLLKQHRPDLLPFPTTAGPWSTGDGIVLGQALGAATIDMEHVQLHPTGFVDPADPASPSKVLAAELTRGVGGILLNDRGQRFANELGLRSYVTDQMLRHDAHYREIGAWRADRPAPAFALVLGSAAAAEARRHVDFYAQKGLLTRLETGGVAALAEWLGAPRDTVAQTLRDYQTAADRGTDDFGKTSFRGVPEVSDTEIFYVGRVTPVLHYCMGGLQIDPRGRVLSNHSNRPTPIPGLFAAGEVSGGVHGVNRLGGNSLLECTVFGRIVGNGIPVQAVAAPAARQATAPNGNTENDPREKKRQPPLRTVSAAELAQHATPDDCWVAVRGRVYDLTQFAGEHPAGKGPIHMYAGKDATETFDILHNPRLLQQYADALVVVGKYGG